MHMSKRGKSAIHMHNPFPTHLSRQSLYSVQIIHSGIVKVIRYSVARSPYNQSSGSIGTTLG